MRPVPRAFRAVLWPSAVAAALGLWLTRPRGAPGPADLPDAVDAQALTLHLPLGLVLLVGLLRCLATWPGFGRDRDGRRLIARLRVGPVDGCAGAALGTLAALAVVLPLTGAAFDLLRSERRPATTRHERPALIVDAPRDPSGRPLLHAGAAHLTLRLPPGVPPAAELLARPRLVFARAADAGGGARLALRIAGHQLPGSAQELPYSGAALRLRLPPEVTAGDCIDLLWLPPGRGVAAFPPGSLLLRWQGTGSATASAMLAALCALCTAALGLGLAVLTARGAARAVVALAAVGAPLAASVLGLAPHAVAVERYAAGVWSLGPALADPVLGSLSIAVLAMLGAVRTRTA